MDMRKFNILFLGTLAVLSSCTDLEVKEKDSIVIESTGGEFTGIDPVAGLTTGYTDLRVFGDQANIYSLLEVSSDELLIPTRGTDWGDNGAWRTIHQHSWDASHNHILTTWNQLNSNIYRLNQLLAPESNASAQQLAEGRFLRAFNMFFLIDLFGQVPFREVNDGPDDNPRVMTRQEAFEFAMQDLTDALPNLPTVAPGLGTKQASKAAARFLMAKMLLNKFIYYGQAEAAAADMNQVIQLVDAIKADGYDLDAGYFDIFKNTADTETILFTDASVGNRMWNGLHYAQNHPDNVNGGWNGFSTTAEFYALFEGDPNTNVPGSGQEERRGYVPTTPDANTDVTGVGYGFLIGQQYDENGNELKDRSGNPLAFTKNFVAITGNNERNGIRVIKYHPDNGAFTEHYIFFRYADAHLMKIEAILRGGSSSETALELYNELRTIRNATTKGSVDLAEILNERGRELYIEGWRRNDQIRFGTFTSTWTLKDNTEAFRVLFPIPSRAISSNPNLKQNPGY
jgi:starch-binding outer membrane protein, SusD/RagB family